MITNKPPNGRLWQIGLLVLLCLVSMSCDALEIPSTPIPTLAHLPTPTLIATISPDVLPSLPTAVSTPTPLPDTGWQTLRPGLERRLINLFNNEGQPVDSLYLLRIEPDRYRFGVAYRPGQPQTLPQWQHETGALIVVNAGYFTEAYLHTGRIIADGQASGTTYGDFAGMLAITAAGPELRWLRERPYDASEPLLAGLQSFPLLVKPGGVLGFPEEDGRISRRTVVAQDRNGRILFLLAPWGSFTLHQLSHYLVTSDLDLDIALNLDGGTSTGLLLTDPAEGIPAFIPLPAVITVHSLEESD